MKKQPLIPDSQLNLAFEKLAELRDMAPLVFKGYEIVNGKPMASERRERLRQQVREIQAKRQA